MRLRELYLYGFKSFPYKTRILFGEGITAIVGPNGCGKSNIMDGLRWVLGEQNFSLLRCSKNEDLIFLGTEGTPPLGYAEVKLILSNDSIPDYGTEIEIQRRFFKSGESEYLLNRSPCKLKDIESIFSNSGGSRNYSIFNQSLIRQVLSGDISKMLEEAAGIAKYKQQREEVNRRLETSETDLLRLNDIISLHEKRTSELSHQAKRAQLYEELKQEYDRLSLMDLKNRYDKVGLKREEILSQIIPLKKSKENLFLKMDEKGRELEKIRRDLREVKKEGRTLQTQMLQLRERQLSLEADIKYSEKEKERLDEEEKEREIALNSLEGERDNIEKGLSTLKENLKTLKAEMEKLQGEVKTKEENLFEIRESLQREEENLRETFNEYNGITKEILKREANLANLEEYKNRLYKEKEGTEEEVERLKEELETLGEKKGEKENEFSLSQNSFEDIQKVLAEKKETYEKELERKRNLEGEISSITSRLSLLEARIGRKRGEKLKKSLKDKIIGQVFELVKPEKGIDKPLQAVISPIAELFFLKDKKLEISSLDRGERWGFLLDRNYSTPQRKYPRGKGVIGPLHKFIKSFPHTPAFLKDIIDRFTLVKDYSTLLYFSEHYPSLSFVTLDGVAWFAEGILIIESEGEPSFMEIEELKADESSKRELLKKIEENLKGLEKEIGELELNQKERESAFLAFLKENSLLEAELSNVKIRLERSSEELKRLSREFSKIDNEIIGLAKEKGELLKKREGLEEKQRKIEERVKGLETLVGEREKEVKEVLSKESGFLTKLARLEENKKGMTKKLAEFSSEEEKSLHRLSKIREERENLNMRLKNLRSELKEVLENLNLLETRKGEIERIRDLELKEESCEKSQRELNERLQSLQNSIFSLQMEELEFKKEQEKMEEEARRDYKADISSLSGSGEPSRDRLEMLRTRLHNLGSINPLALSEYNREKEELDNLKTQREDIVKAKENLLATIKEIDRYAVKEYRKTFEKVRKVFKETFSEFFEGGEADLILKEKSPLWTSEIEIMARPKGKKLKMLNQLSDGEKTLLAIAFLFALYRIKPAPFCFLDEIDAALDDANSRRFVKFLKELSRKTQVTIITHNRETIAQANTLYGVTMETPGISKLVSVKLDELRKGGE